ncbi:hypothetical protein DL89DRAFT_107804 [Linderina pennispora]|uniref:Uncharacterized protein n=1 Tax=Linderina pennispora TaxID=61395 RepID=A0A1Y1WEW8_9FUNG|nr:uncharacterized protein DL89DRAFT_107804 [Linderina pennispora]ORX72080.1 hypothetical protein DL89DRAFT_107804 [Linderina pennispora]
MTESERMGAGEQAAESAMDNEERISALMATQGVRSYTVVNDTPAGEMKVHYDGDSATMYAAAGESRGHEGMETFVEATPTQYYEHQKERLAGEGGSHEAPNHFVNMHGDSAYEYEHEQSYPGHEQSYPGHEQSYLEHEQSYPEHEQLYSDREHEQAYSEGENGHSAVDSGHRDAPNNFVNVHGDAAFAHDADLALPSHITSNSPMFSATTAAAGNEPRAVNELDPLSYGSEIYTHRKDLPLVAPADKPVSAHPVVMTMPQSPFAPTLAEDMHPVIRFVMSTISAATAPPSSQGPSFPPGPWPTGSCSRWPCVTGVSASGVTSPFSSGSYASGPIASQCQM